MELSRLEEQRLASTSVEATLRSEARTLAWRAFKGKAAAPPTTGAATVVAAAEVCHVCKRKFPSMAALQAHVEGSAMHRENVLKSLAGDDDG